MTRVIFILAIATVAAWLIREAVRQCGMLFRIDVRNGHFELKGTIPGRPWSDVRSFLSKVSLPARCHIVGVRDGRRFRLDFSGNIDEGTRQRIRNFLYL